MRTYATATPKNARPCALKTAPMLMTLTLRGDKVCKTLGPLWWTATVQRYKLKELRDE